MSVSVIPDWIAPGSRVEAWLPPAGNKPGYQPVWWRTTIISVIPERDRRHPFRNTIVNIFDFINYQSEISIKSQLIMIPGRNKSLCESIRT